MKNNENNTTGLYDASFEHDSCGVGFIVNIQGTKSHKLVRQAFEIGINLLHRGACGCEKNTGDGAGILLQLPHKFLSKKTAAIGFELPAPGSYGVGVVFLPRDQTAQQQIENIFTEYLECCKNGAVNLPLQSPWMAVNRSGKAVMWTFH